MSAPRRSTATSLLRVAVIGTGRIGRMHAELLASRVPGAALAAVSDAVAELAEEVGSAAWCPRPRRGPLAI